MQCVRCAGLSIPEIIFEEGARILAMRCIQCGEVIDDVILLNRRRPRSIRLGRARTSNYEDNCLRRSRPVPSIP